MPGPAPHTYREAGVDRDAAAEFIRRVKPIAERTHGAEVLAGPGGFGALYSPSGFDDPVLVSSTDGVGTKLKLAIAMSRYETIGEDLVNACVNDVIVSGAKPLFFLDYIAVGKLDPDVLETIAAGMGRACEVSGCALIGGETAELPGMYGEGDFDLAGFAVGAVERRAILGPSTVEAGDVLVGLPSNGLHTNGYSLVRAALGLDEDPSPLYETYDELGGTLGDALIAPHTAYWPMVSGLGGLVKSMAHVTGGGLVENVPRALPPGVGAAFDTSTWPLPPVFPVLQELCGVDVDEMYRVFNMGLGMVLVCGSDQADAVLAAVPEAGIVGEVTPATADGRVTLQYTGL